MYNTNLTIAGMHTNNTSAVMIIIRALVNANWHTSIRYLCLSTPWFTMVYKAIYNC